MRLKNDFSWSFSRAGIFDECPKKYWYTYYGSWEGWPKTPYDERPFIDPLASYLYRLKQMQKIPTFVGSCVHTAIEHFLKKRTTTKALAPFDLQELTSYGQKLFEEGINDSKNEKWRLSPKKHANLFEHYYGVGISDEVYKASKEKISSCLSNWFSSRVVQELAFNQKSPQKCFWISIEQLSSFQLAGEYKIIVVVDFALSWQQNAEKQIAILFDWKTGEESQKTEEQLMCYALFAHRVLGFAHDRILLVPFYLAKNKYTKIGFDQEEKILPEKLKSTEAEILQSCKTLSALHGSDVLHFPYTQERTRCEGCQFKELCSTVQYKNVSVNELRNTVGELQTHLTHGPAEAKRIF